MCKDNLYGYMKQKRKIHTFKEYVKLFKVLQNAVKISVTIVKNKTKQISLIPTSEFIVQAYQNVQ